MLGFPNPASSMRTSRTFGAPSGGRRMPDEVPVGLRPVEGPIDDSVERLSADRELAAVDLAHLQRPPRVPAVTRADSLPALNRVSGLGPGSSVSALCAGIADEARCARYALMS